LLFENEKAERLKLCDFGLADWIQPGEHMSGIVGSPTYMGALRAVLSILEQID
jgi:serine/threonine protein kinase